MHLCVFVHIFCACACVNTYMIKKYNEINKYVCLKKWHKDVLFVHLEYDAFPELTVHNYLNKLLGLNHQ